MDETKKTQWDELKKEIKAIDPDGLWGNELAAKVATELFVRAIDASAGVNEEGIRIDSDTMIAIAEDAKVCGKVFAHVMLGGAQKRTKRRRKQ